MLLTLQICKAHKIYSFVYHNVGTLLCMQYKYLLKCNELGGISQLLLNYVIQKRNKEEHKHAMIQ